MPSLLLLLLFSLLLLFPTILAETDSLFLRDGFTCPSEEFFDHNG